MGVKLRDVPPSGLTFSTDEYNRHKAIYFPIMKLRRCGPNFIEDGILYAHVRVCLIEEGGDPATCEGTTQNVVVRQPTTGRGNSSQRGNQDGVGERAVPGQSPDAERGPSRRACGG
jgi:hypothetical protein